jgi:DNA-directed RNA polymerase subunit RPC12/RpoP
MDDETSQTPRVGEGSTQTATPVSEAGESRVFPCEKCGADLTFNIGQQDLKCGYCGFEKALDFPPDAKLEEQDFEATLKRLAVQRSESHPELPDETIVHCSACGANVVFTGTLTSTACAYCGSPVQLQKVHDSPARVPVDGVLPFLVDADKAGANLTRWVASRWFAPTEFRLAGVRGKFNGVYLPYWTFDSMTANRFTGERGDHYYVTVGSGKEERQELRVDWTRVSGAFQLFFDDVLTLAALQLPVDVMVGLEPWPLAKCLPFNPECLAGFQARTYDLPLDQGFVQAKIRMDEAIRRETCRHIGGDEQRIEVLDTQHNALTYKHVLLPVWLLAYRYQNRAFLVAVNGATGEVQGERPYSWIKITIAVVLATVAVVTAVLMSQH